jgi:hypothetical protein
MERECIAKNVPRAADISLTIRQANDLMVISQYSILEESVPIIALCTASIKVFQDLKLSINID